MVVQQDLNRNVAHKKKIHTSLKTKALVSITQE